LRRNLFPDCRQIEARIAVYIVGNMRPERSAEALEMSERHGGAGWSWLNAQCLPWEASSGRQRGHLVTGDTRQADNRIARKRELPLQAAGVVPKTEGEQIQHDEDEHEAEDP
jgi:hypothetical protein